MVLCFFFLASTVNNKATNKPKEQSQNRGHSSRAAERPSSSSFCRAAGERHSVTQSLLVLGCRSGKKISRSAAWWSLPESGARSASDGGTRRHARGWCTPLSHRGSGWGFIHTSLTPVWNPACQQAGGCTSGQAEPPVKVLDRNPECVSNYSLSHSLTNAML